MQKENVIQKGLVFSVALVILGTNALSTFNGVNTPTPSPIRGITLYVGGGGANNYTYIQDAIDNASNGDNIIVYPGTYNEDQITVDKALTITGSGWTTCIIDGEDASLPSFGLVRIVADGNVTFKGFTVKNAGGPPNGGDYGDDLTNVGIYAQSDSSDATYTITNNKILGTNNPDDWEDYGFYTNSGQEHLIFKENAVTQTAGNAVLIEKHEGSTELSYNTLDAGCWGIDPIYCMTYGGTDITSLQKISHNIIDVGTGINPHGSGDNKITGMGFSSAYLGCTGSDDSGKYTDIEISHNTIQNLQAYERGIALDNFAWGDGAGGDISNAVIKDNVFEGISTASPSFAIRLSGLISDTDIHGNSITGCDMSFLGTSGFYGDSTAYPIGTMVYDNNFEGNGNGFVWDGPATMDAENNWWGNTSGPQDAGNPDGTGDPVDGNVDYTPWLLHPYGPPYAAFMYSIDDRNVTFDASASGDYDGTITTYDWNFGDTTFGQGEIITHDYPAYQTYTATLTVTDNDGRTNSISKTFTLSDYVPPVINTIQALPDPQHVGDWVNISCMVSDNVAVSEVKVNVTYPDVSTINQTMTYNAVTCLAIFNITYGQLGVYNYFIWASDTNGNTKRSAVHSFQITNQAPYAPSSPNPSNGSTGVNINAMISWVGGDPDGDTMTYDVYFGTGSSPPKVLGNQSSQSYDPPGMMGYSTLYYWKIVAWDEYGASAAGPVWHFTTMANGPPVFGIPSPFNGSSGRPLSFTWSVPISDPEGNSFDWTIQCSNGQTDSGSGASNGTKSLALSGLSYGTTYTVWVNATDPGGSGLYTRMWYVFSTEGNYPPIFGAPSPANGSTGEPLSLTWSIPISDPDGDSFDWTIQCTNGQTNGATGASNGTKSLALSGLSYSTTYKIWVNATDPDGSEQYTRVWYVFTTQQQVNNPPNVPCNESPVNGAANVSVSADLSWTCDDPDGDPVTYDVYFGTTTAPSMVSSNQSTMTYDPGMLASHTTYYWQIVARDDQGKTTVGPLWNFTTEIIKDVTPPLLSLEQPLQGYLYLNVFDLLYLKIHFFMTFVIGKITVMADATDTQSGINRVEFWVDAELRCNDTTAPYEWDWSERGFFQRTLKVVAYDNAGNTNYNITTLWKFQFR